VAWPAVSCRGAPAPTFPGTPAANDATRDARASVHPSPFVVGRDATRIDERANAGAAQRKVAMRAPVSEERVIRSSSGLANRIERRGPDVLAARSTD